MVNQGVGNRWIDINHRVDNIDNTGKPIIRTFRYRDMNVLAIHKIDDAFTVAELVVIRLIPLDLDIFKPQRCNHRFALAV